MKTSTMIRLQAIALALFCTTSLMAQTAGSGGRGGMNPDPDRATTGGGVFPAGWSVRTDANRQGVEPPTDQVIFKATDGGAYHFTLGPAVTVANPGWTKTGDYSFSARLTQTKKPTHQIAYGLYFGGSDLRGPNQTYTYFMVRNTGEYLIKIRKGKELPVIKNWVTNTVVNKEDANGKQVNTLGIQVQGANVIFTINGTEVERIPKADLITDGQYGFRVDHNLDVDIDQVKRP